MVALVTLALSGCLPFSGGPIKASVVDGQLALAFCTDLTLDSIEVLQSADGQVNGYTILWKATGAKDIRSGDIIIIGQDTDDLTTTEVGSFDSAEGNRYSVTANYGSGEALQPTFHVPDNGFLPGEWVAGTGLKYDEPCS